MKREIWIASRVISAAIEAGDSLFCGTIDGKENTVSKENFKDLLEAIKERNSKNQIQNLMIILKMCLFYPF